MIKYNFAKRYKKIKVWSYDKNSQIIVSTDKEVLTIENKFISYLKRLKYLIQFANKNKILFAPSLSILFLTILIQVVALIPTINIKRFESFHYQYEDNVNSLNDINKNLESEFNSFIKYASIYSIGAPDYLFGYYLQSLIPEEVQLSDYTIDNYGFKINAIGTNITSINKLLNLLIDNQLIESESLKLRRLIDQSSLSSESTEENKMQAGVIVEITGQLNETSLQSIIELNKKAFNYGALSKLNQYSSILNLFIK